VRDNLGMIQEVLWRALLSGTGLFLLLTPDRLLNLNLNVIFFLAVTAWSFADRMTSQTSPLGPLLEGAIVHLLAVQISNLLIFLTGQPVWS